MRTALAVWEMHCVDSATILGLLVDRTNVSVVLGWIDEKSKQYMVQEISDSRYVFDITELYDAFRLFQMLRAQSSMPFREHIQGLIDAHTNEAMQVVSHLEYQSWKSPKRVPGGLFDHTDEADSALNMQTWSLRADSS
ncbi:hypothetical protein BDZ89DRAFT_1152532 [Hymenopellis radicata]|nr:hypothetical protein BDZ89DRAFT_1152532 [Hymenopellis radicata]